jgi:tol-pal system protein YbgF
MNRVRMKKDVHWGYVCVIFFALILLSACVYDEDRMAYLNDQYIALNKRVTQLQDSQKALDAKVGDDLDTKLGSIGSSQVEIRVEMDQLKVGMSDLSRRIEENEHVLKRTVERDLGEQDAMKADLAGLSQRVAEMETLSPGRQGGTGTAGTREDPQRSESLARQPATEAQRPSEVVLYDDSLASFKEGQYEDAMDGFRAFLRDYPDSDRADNSQFWIGECHMALQQYEKAILAYQDVIKKYPKGNKVPNALLRQAGAFSEINDKTSAKLLLKKIIEKYPRSDEAQIARKKLETL